MICAVCYGVIRGHQGRQWRGTFDLHFGHQTNLTALEKSASLRCTICMSILAELSRIEEKNHPGLMTFLGEELLKILSGDVLRHQVQVDKARDKAIKSAIPWLTASLSEIHSLRHLNKLYRLDFTTKNSETVGTFVFQKTGDRDTGLFHTSFSDNTSSDEVLEVAKGWINDCVKEHPECRAPTPKELLLPSRLIDLGAVVESGKPGQRWKRENPEQVRLVMTAETPLKSNEVYVTLSHCWGKAQFLRLEGHRIEEFCRSIAVKSLPKTFRDAIIFARSLGRKVRYIWIDSLCIIQGRSEAQLRDWLTESSKMFEIYRNSYCNISATAASDSEQGLFASREPQDLWEDEVNLNVEGLEGIPGHESRHLHPIKRCSMLDLSFWEKSVNSAPVNQRAWVLQERLMAPRVLHFCRNQIAWECSRFDAAESYRDGLPSYRLKGKDVVAGMRLKGNLEEDLSKQDRSTAVYHQWKRVVEVYSKTKLTNGADKLIALSGIAKMMSASVGGTYIAGLWRAYLGSQLLWRVDPVFEHGVFFYPSKRPGAYRAPSFSWAAVDAPQGIVYGEISEDGMLLNILEAEVLPPSGTHDNFGLVQSAHLLVSGLMKRIVMRKHTKHQTSTQYRWNLGSKALGLSQEYSTVYLDSPESDEDIFGSQGNVYCLTARFDAKNYLICILLQEERKNGQWTKNYRRIGITKIPPYDKNGQERVLEISGDESEVPCASWDATTRQHTIRIV